VILAFEGWTSMTDTIGSPPATVLVVDDEPGVRELLTSALAAEGYATEVAADGVAAVARLARDGIDLVLLDLTMPGLDGLTVCRQVRAQTPPAQPYLPILMLTALIAIADQREGFAAGADDYIVKPFDVETLLARVAVWLRVRRVSQTALAAQAQAEAARQAAQVEAIHLTARTLADRLNNDLAGMAGVLGLVEMEAALSPDLREVLPVAVRSLDHASQIVTQLYEVTRIATHDTPLGPALDLERSAAADEP
jgi:DNA-binding response OmpR family regulator